MADDVRRALEEMVPELEDMEDRGYFSKSEIKQIIQKRQNFEYNLRRRAALQSDFLRYIDYENNLERLRQLRKKQRVIEGADTLADHCIVRRTHFIYERACRKFRGDLSLWSRWIEFCKQSKSTRQMSRVLTRALQLHSTCASLWTYAAAWEFDHNANAVAARALMQRGLRMCKESPRIWHEYFKMELLYAARLVARRKVLLGSVGGGGSGAGGGEDEATIAVLKGAVAKVVYNNAVSSAFGSDFEFRAEFLRVLQSTVGGSAGGLLSGGGVEDLEEHIMQDMESTFGSTSPKIVSLKAHRILSTKRATTTTASATDDNDEKENAWKEAMDLFSIALQECDTQEKKRALDEEYLRFLGRSVRDRLHKGDGPMAMLLIERYIEHCRVVVVAGQQGYENYALSAALAYLRIGRVDKAAETLTVVEVTGARGNTILVGLHSILSSIGGIRRTTPTTGVTEGDLVRLVEMDVDNEETWYVALRTAIAHNYGLKPFATLLVHRQRGRARGPVRGDMGGAAAAIVSGHWSLYGPREAREFYNELFALPLPGGEVVHAVLDAELSLVGAEEGEGEAAALPGSKIREIFEIGVDSYGDVDEELWLRYLKFEYGRRGGGIGVGRCIGGR